VSIRIREAQLEDLEFVLPLVKEFVISFEVEEHSYQRSFRRLIDSREATILVSEHEGNLIGYCLGFCHDTFYANGKVAWLEEIMVLSAHRREGIGQSMMASFEQWAKAQGCILSALATRRASLFYLALGYEESATYYRKLL
jgi:GNAT superfamily N-acetyltransferase